MARPASSGTRQALGAICPAADPRRLQLHVHCVQLYRADPAGLDPSGHAIHHLHAGTLRRGACSRQHTLGPLCRLQPDRHAGSFPAGHRHPADAVFRHHEERDDRAPADFSVGYHLTSFAVVPLLQALMVSKASDAPNLP